MKSEITKKNKYDLFTAEKLRSILEYNEETGLFKWKPSASKYIQKNKVAGSTDSNGHIQIRINWTGFMAHRLAWLYVFGEWPKGEIDHINGLHGDNRICNLRECSRSENSQNLPAKRNNSSGFLGVSKHATNGGWAARITIEGKTIRLGIFDTPELAHQEYCRAKKEVHNFQKTPRICEIA